MKVKGLIIPALLTLALAAPAQAATLTGNVRCNDLDPNYQELKIEPVKSGIYTQDSLEINLKVDGLYFTYTANRPLNKILVKGGDDTELWDPKAALFHAPINPNNQKPYGLSHLSFCYGVAPPVDPPLDPPVDPPVDPPLDPSVDVPPPPAPPILSVKTAPEEAPAQLVLPERFTPGSSRLLAPEGCRGTVFKVRVQGSQIRSVTFFLDGKRLKTSQLSLKTFGLTINPKSLSVGAHRIKAVVRYQRSSQTRTKTMRAVFHRCGRQLQAPRFTG